MPVKFVAPVFILAAAGCGSGTPGNDPNAAVYDAWLRQRSNVAVTARGSVARLLGIRRAPGGDAEGFLLHLRGAGGHGLTVRIEDNVTATGPVPLAPGDEVEVRGVYVYDANGGVIDDTYKDRRGRHPAGYIRAEGRTFM